jgi:hypothetical protein
MKDLLRHRARVDFDADRKHRQKKFAIAWLIEKSKVHCRFRFESRKLISSIFFLNEKYSK